MSEINPTTKTETQASIQSEKKGLHKIFLGFAPGTGKTFAMLDEAHRRLKRGQDVVLASAESYGRKGTEELLPGIENVADMPTHSPNLGKKDLDLDAILARKPELVVIDDLAHENGANASHQFRWEDIQVLLQHEISVLSTLNVYNLESLNDKVAEITGVRIKETVPDTILHSADEIELVDLTPQAAMNRLNRGEMFPEGFEHPYKAIFTEEKLTALRELAFREAAGRVDEDIEGIRKTHAPTKPWQVHERILICIGPSSSSLRLIRRGWKIAQRMQSMVVAISVKERSHSPEEKLNLEADFRLAERLGIEVIPLEGRVADRIVEYARENAITQIVIGHSSRSSWQQRLKRSLIAELAGELRNIDILVMATEKEKPVVQ